MNSNGQSIHLFSMIIKQFQLNLKLSEEYIWIIGNIILLQTNSTLPNLSWPWSQQPIWLSIERHIFLYLMRRSPSLICFKHILQVLNVHILFGTFAWAEMARKATKTLKTFMAVKSECCLCNYQWNTDLLNPLWHPVYKLKFSYTLPHFTSAASYKSTTQPQNCSVSIMSNSPGVDDVTIISGPCVLVRIFELNLIKINSEFCPP